MKNSLGEPMRLSLVMIFSLCLSGCMQLSETSLSRYHEDGRVKPSIIVTQLLDTSSFDVPWSLSEELTSLVTNNLSQNRALYVAEKEEISPSENPFGNDLTWAAKELNPYEFAVFLELVDHSYRPVMKENTQSLRDASINLDMAVRVRVVDLRGGTSKIILQELVKESYYIPKTLQPVDYSLITWGTSEYQKSPLAIAHAELARILSERLNDYILLAKSR